jgi:hypothetical protein
VATRKEVNESIRRLMALCSDVLNKKGADYAGDSEDRLKAFKIGKLLNQYKNADPQTDIENGKRVLWGYLLKHITSISSMCISRKHSTREEWDEKLIDSINYLLLLSAIVDEEIKEAAAIEDKVRELKQAKEKARGEKAEKAAERRFENKLKDIALLEGVEL